MQNSDILTKQSSHLMLYCMSCHKFTRWHFTRYPPCISKLIWNN